MSNTVNVYNDVYDSPLARITTNALHERDIYIAKNLALIKGLVVHFLDAAELTNDLYELIMPDAANAPRSAWKYYKNLAGEYATLDELMYIVSIDTYETIVFNLENMAIHKATRNKLITDETYRDNFHRKYPGYEMLIAGILNPIPIEVSTNAKDGDILYYPKHLVEFNEYSLIEDLSVWIKRHTDRWYNAQYLHADELYTASYYSTLWPAMLNALLMLRENRIHTLEVHTFHVSQYLASHGLLDRFLPELTHKQRLWLYRNIRYIKKHAGHHDVFLMMVDNLLKPSNIPLDGYYMSLINDELGVRARFETKPYSNTQSVNLSHHNHTKYHELQDNKFHNVDVSVNVESNEIDHSVYGRVRTKMLESTIIEDDDNAIYGELEFLHDHWLYYAFTGMYTSYVVLTDIEHATTVTMSVSDAYILMAILLSELTGNPFAVRKPEVVQVRNSVDYATYNGVADPMLVRTTVDFVNYNLGDIHEHVSVNSFNDTVGGMYVGFINILHRMHTTDNPDEEVLIQHILADVYKKVDLALDTNDVLWRESTNFTISPKRRENKEKLFVEIIQLATGYNGVSNTTLRMQDSLLKIMEQLSSYAISYNVNTVATPNYVMELATTHIYSIINQSVYDMFIDMQALDMSSTSDVTDITTLYMAEDAHTVLDLVYSYDITEQQITTKYVNRVSFELPREQITMENAQ